MAVKKQRKRTQIKVNCSFDEMVSLSSLKPHPDNPNQHSDQQIELLTKLLKCHGWRAPIVVSNKSGFITRGHGRLMAAKAANQKKVPVDYQDYASDELELADLVADNAIQEASYFDRDMLRDVLGEIDSHPVDMELTGFVVVDLQKLFEAAPPPDALENTGSGDGKTTESGGETDDDETGEKNEPKDKPEESGEDLNDDVPFEFGDFKGKVQKCVFDDFNERYEELRAELGVATLDDVLKYMIGIEV